MSNAALAIAGVTAVLEYLLGNVYSSANLGSVLVSAVAPDLVHGGAAGGSNTPLQVNLFLHQVTYNAAWRNVWQPSLAADGKTRLTNPPLALDLHYLLTAYGSEDCEAEALLGFAIQLLHETPVVPRGQVALGLASLPTSNPVHTLLTTSGLAEQIEMLKISPATLGREELAWLWTALKADYRPTFPFQVSVVLIQPDGPAISALPVLERKVVAKPEVFASWPTLATADPLNGQPAACLGDTVRVTGASLAGVSSVVLVNSRLGVSQTITPLSAVENSSFQFTIPNPALPPPQPNPTDLPAGVYLLSAQVIQGTDVIMTNGVSLAIAPRIGAAWAPGIIASGTAIAVTIPCAPYIRFGQAASLIIGDQQAPANLQTAATPPPPPTNSPSFTFANLNPTSLPVPVRLRVDGIDSPIIDLGKSPPAFFPAPSVRVT
jgi:Pvc16 N-terminal domain